MSKRTKASPVRSLVESTAGTSVSKPKARKKSARQSKTSAEYDNLERLAKPLVQVRKDELETE